MNEAKQHLDVAFSLLRQISVREDDVERMSIAKREIQTAYRLLGNTEESEEKTDG